MSNANNNEKSNLESEDVAKAKSGHIVKNSEDNIPNNPYNEPIGFKKIQLTTTIICCFVTLVIGFFIGKNWYKVESDVNFTAKKGEVDFSSLNEVYSLLAENYDGDLNTSKVIEEAKRGLVNAAEDKYTYYMTTAEAEEFNKDLEGDVGAGIGVEIGERDGYTKVLRTTEDNPARRAGVLAGDIMYKVGDEDVSALGVEEISKRLRGEAGTEVTFTVVRDGEEKTFTVTREKINNASVYVTYRNGGKTAVLTISRFDSDTGTLARQKANEIKSKGCEKVILDLRGNGGGYVSAAQEVASLWLDGDLVYEQRSKNGYQDDKGYARTGAAVLKDMKTVVLINGSTASASEIVAGALHDHGKAALIGEKSYGKGSVQALEKLRDGSVLRVTIAKWYTPNGNNINGDGIEPDKKVERTFEQINKEQDPQLDAALAY